ncbi:antibiotic biosynthesis monooxygenase [Streptomyces sp. NP160]|uniref:putative quinol monooxygenase n=1 Tax=Streptomyces sp. NP160 TaxID=2586637 RepID=UPI001119708E|nr:antibiotic biosynthesis monooxygenase family protein [Streptomyces sp. NP160]TNM60162.1 antibiotic biosynthesis monooxygenase [Streptomyces sp. NP160]
MPTAVTSLLELTLSPEAAADPAAAHAVITETLAATRAFDGCLGCDVLVDVDDPARLVVHERWESLAHDDAYRAWRRTPEGASRLGEVLAGPPQLTRFTTADGV